MKAKFIIFITILFLLTSCGTAPYDKAAVDMEFREESTYASTENGYFGVLTDGIYPETEDVKEGYYTSVTTESTVQNQSVDVNRKLIREASLYMETKEYDAFMSSLEKQVAMVGGYVQSARSEGNPEYSNRWMNYVLRIPENQYDAFLENINTLGTVTSHSENVTDITLNYTDTESRIKALETEYDTLIAILEKCDTLTDVITVQSRITEVTYQLENYKSTLRTYDNQVAYCTVRLNVSEVQKITEPQKNISVGERMKREILDNWKDFVDDVLDFFVWFVSALPTLIIWAVIIVVVVTLTRRSIRKRKMKKNVNMMYNIQPAPETKENTEIKK